MTTSTPVNGTYSPSLSLPMPRSPPKLPDLYGKHRLQVQLQALNRELGFLEDELQSLESFQPTSRICLEVDEFVATNSDPLIPEDRRIKKSHFWKWLCCRSSCNVSILCCSSGCLLHLKKPRCSCDLWRKCRSCSQCSCRCHFCNCLEKLTCSPCAFPTSCPDCSCACNWSCPKCSRLCNFYSKCLKRCCCLLCC